MVILHQSTASQKVLLGPFVDSTDFNTEKTGLTIANTDIKLYKNNASAQVNKNSGGATHDANGSYTATLDATDTNTIGWLKITVHVATALPVQLSCLVLPTIVYNAVMAGSEIAADCTKMAGDSVSPGLIANLYNNAASSGFTVAATPTPTLSSFGTGTSGVDGDFEDSIVVWLTGANSGGICTPRIVRSYTATNGVIVLTKPLHAVPSVGDTGVLVGTAG